MKHALGLLLCFYCVATFGQNGPPTPQQVRGMIEGQIRQLNIKPEPVFKVENAAVWTGTDSIKIRIYHPSNTKNLPLIFNVHGGALVAGNLDSHDNISRILCKENCAIVVSLDYRRPPESPYPAGFNDTWAVLNWLVTNSAQLGFATNSISVISDSGGSLFAAALPAKIKSEKSKITLKSLIFINPALDLRIDPASPPNPMYQLVTTWYLGKTSANDSLVSPLAAKDYSNFPQTLIVTCAKDELKPHGDKLAANLKQAGIPVKLVDIPNEDHYGGFWASAHPRAKPAIDEVLPFFKAAK